MHDYDFTIESNGKARWQKKIRLKALQRYYGNTTRYQKSKWRTILGPKADLPRQIRRRGDAGLVPCPLITHGLTAWTRTYLLGVETFGHGPRGDDIVHDALAEGLGHLVQFHELPHVVQHVVVLGRRRGHLLDDGRHMAEDRRVQQSYRREACVCVCVCGGEREFALRIYGTQ